MFPPAFRRYDPARWHRTGIDGTARHLALDEPLGALEVMTKLTMQDEISHIWREEKVTQILVTHDLEEAIFLADWVLVLPRKSAVAST